MTPVVTVGLPVYNGERYLREALDSILSQTYADLEVLISDNASTDGTAAICRSYAEADRRVRYHRQASNIGIFANAAFTMENATGRYFMLAGDDDVYHEKFVAECLSVVDRDVTVGMVYPDFDYIGPDGARSPGGTRLRMTESDSRFTGLVKFLLRRSALPLMMGVYRREVAVGALPFCSRELAPMTGDVDNVFLVRALAQARAVAAPKARFSYRLKDRSSSFPPDWPASRAGQCLYILRHQRRVLRLMDASLREIVPDRATRLALRAVNLLGAVFFYAQYVLQRLTRG